MEPMLIHTKNPINPVRAVNIHDNNLDTIYVDDMGLYKEINHCFSVKCDNGKTQDLYGNGLILGTEKNGESMAVKTSLKEVKKRISFRGAMHIVTSNNGFEIYPIGVQ